MPENQEKSPVDSGTEEESRPPDRNLHSTEWATGAAQNGDLVDQGTENSRAVSAGL